MEAVRRYPKDEIAARGREMYDRDIRPQVDTPENRGKFLAVDIETGEWEMGSDELSTANQLRARVPSAQPYMTRVGYGYLRNFGGVRRVGSR